MRKILRDIELTRTFKYVVPFLNIKSNLIDSYCVNAYCRDWTHTHYVNHLFLLFEYFEDPIGDLLDRECKGNPNYVEAYKPSDSYIVYVFKIPKSREEDYNRFLNSKYSTISDEGKQVIKEYWKLPPTSEVYGVLYKTERRKKTLENSWAIMEDGFPVSYVPLREDEEYLSVLDMDRETFSLEKLSAL